MRHFRALGGTREALLPWIPWMDHSTEKLLDPLHSFSVRRNGCGGYRSLDIQILETDSSPAFDGMRKFRQNVQGTVNGSASERASILDGIDRTEATEREVGRKSLSMTSAGTAAPDRQTLLSSSCPGSLSSKSRCFRRDRI